MSKKVGRPKKPETIQKENEKLLKKVAKLEAQVEDAQKYEDLIKEHESLSAKLKVYAEREEDYQKIIEENTSLRIMLGEDKKKDDLPDYAFGVAVRNGKYLLAEMRFDVDSGKATVIDSKEFCKNNEHYYAQYEFQKLLSKDDTIIPYKE
jgi:cell shape-determining protein MreC